LVVFDLALTYVNDGLEKSAQVSGYCHETSCIAALAAHTNIGAISVVGLN